MTTAHKKHATHNVVTTDEPPPEPAPEPAPPPSEEQTTFITSSGTEAALSFAEFKNLKLSV